MLIEISLMLHSSISFLLLIFEIIKVFFRLSAVMHFYFSCLYLIGQILNLHSSAFRNFFTIELWPFMIDEYTISIFYLDHCKIDDLKFGLIFII